MKAVARCLTRLVRKSRVRVRRACAFTLSAVLLTQCLAVVPAAAVDDSWEPDDTLAAANAIPTDGTRQYHTIDHPGDVDWVTFEATGGVAYVITTLPHEGTSPCAALTLYNSGGGIIDSDSGSLGTVSRLYYTPPADTTLYVKAYERYTDATGSYDLVVGQQRSMSGTVTAEDTVLPLSGLTVRVYGSTGGGGSYQAATTTTVGDGSWSVTVDPGTYTAVFVSSDTAYCSEYWDGQPEVTTADAIDVTGADITGISPTLTPGGAIEGTATVDGTGAPVSGAYVSTYRWTGSSWNLWNSSTMTDGSGHYRLEQLWPGTYRVRFHDIAGTFADIYYENATSLDGAQSVTVTSGLTTTGVSVAMTDKSTLQGTVTAEVGGAPLAGLEVGVLASGDFNWSYATTTTTEADGTYELKLNAGSYKLRYRDPSGTYATEYWQNVYVEQSATAVVVGQAQVVTRDASLALNGWIEGNVVSDFTTSETFRAIVFGYAASSWWILDYVSAEADGSYSVAVPPGTYKVEFDDQTGAHLPEFWNDKAANPESGDDVFVSAGTATAGIDATLTARAWIEGHVYAEDGTTPLEGVEVACLKPSGSGWMSAGGSDLSEWDGSYQLAVEPGTYAVRFADYTGMYATEYYDDAWLAFSNPTSITVGPGETRSDVDASMEQNGHLTGLVLDAETGLPLSDVMVVPYADVGGEWLSAANAVSTGADGSYELDLRATDWRLRFYDSLEAYAYEYNDDARLLEDAPNIAVSVGTTATATTTELDDWSHITGTATSGEFGGGLSSIYIDAFVFSGGTWKHVDETAYSEGEGHYDLKLPKGSYRVRFDFDYPTSYVQQFYHEMWDLDRATTVTVTPGQTQPGVDARLYYGTHPPDTTCTVTPNGDDEVLVTLTAQGRVADVAETWYSLDGAAVETYVDPVVVDSTVEHQVEFGSVDTLGNHEATRTVDLPDTVLPTIATLASTTHPDSDTWYPGRIGTFEWTANPDGSGIAGYSVASDKVADTIPDEVSDGTAETITYQPYTDGESYFHVRALDGAGNWGPTTHVRIRVDGTKPNGTMKLDGGAATTQELQVTVNSAVTDAHAMTMRFSTSNGSAWSSWKTYAAQSNLTLPEGVGEKTVIAQYRDVAGNVLELSDSITLEDALPDGLFDRWDGTDRYATACEISKQSFPDGAATVVIATGVEFADALAASGLAGGYQAPLLLTKPTSLPSAVASEIKRLGAKQAIIVGGTSAVSAGVAAVIDGISGVTVDRIAGNNRYETAALVADRIASVTGAEFSHRAFVARGDDFADALAVSPLAYSQGMPVLLVKTTSLPGQTSGAIMRNTITECIISGGTAAVSDGVQAQIEGLSGVSVQRWYGADRYATAADVATKGIGRGWASWQFVGVATGTSFPDALGGGVASGSFEGVLLMTKPAALPSATRSALNAHAADIDCCRVYGGVGAVGEGVQDEIDSILR